MMTHKKLKEGNWHKLSLIEQMGNVGSEASRTLNWKGKSEKDAELSFIRFLELINLTMKDRKNKRRLKEIARVKEMFTDWYMGTRLYDSTKEDWASYFLHFAVLARLGR